MRGPAFSTEQPRTGFCERALRRMRIACHRFDRCERGLEALQVVMIIAVAAVCLIAVKNQWPAIRDWFSELVSIVIEV